MLNNDTNGLNGLKKTAKVKLIEKKWHSEVTHITPVVDQLHAGVSLELVLYFVRNKRERERERESSVKHEVIIA